jgi:hypothetical protein
MGENCEISIKILLQNAQTNSAEGHEDGKNWEQLIPYLMFSVQKVPQSSTRFSPFHLLCGRSPR